MASSIDLKCALAAFSMRRMPASVKWGLGTATLFFGICVVCAA